VASPGPAGDSRGARLLGLLDGTDAAPPETLEIEAADKTADKPAKTASNLEYENWISRDQIVLSYLLQSLSSEVRPHVQRIEHTAGVWQAIEEMFASQSYGYYIYIVRVVLDVLMVVLLQERWWQPWATAPRVLQISNLAQGRNEKEASIFP
jgi:hypothetical protein